MGLELRSVIKARCGLGAQLRAGGIAEGWEETLQHIQSHTRHGAQMPSVNCMAPQDIMMCTAAPHFTDKAGQLTCPKVTHFKGAEPGLEPGQTVSFTTEATGQEGFQKKTKREPLGLAIRRPLESSRNRERSPRSGIEEGIGDLGAQGVEGSCSQCHSRTHTPKRTGEATSPAVPVVRARHCPKRPASLPHSSTPQWQICAHTL